MSTKRQLQAIIRKAAKELGAIRDYERYKRYRKYTGKFFKFDNEYSDDERWPTYFRVISVNTSGVVTMQSFDIDSLSRVHIDTSINDPFPFIFETKEKVTEIPAEEYWQAWRKTIEFISAQMDSLILQKGELDVY